jgi:hypothetical protein
MNTTKNKPMKTYHNDPTIKAKYIARVKAHRIADDLIQGTGWKNGKGCAVGCTLGNYDHSRYPIELGIVEGLARLEDHIFEALSSADAMDWPEQFLSAIPEGVDERQQMILLDQFQVFWLERQKTQMNGEEYPRVITAIEQVIALLNRAIAGDEPSNADWLAAWSAAWTAEISTAGSAALTTAGSAAGSAAWSTAGSAAWSAAGSAARSAERSAERSAAGSAAWSAVYAAAGSAAWSAERSAERSEAIAKRDWLLNALAALSTKPPEETK